MTRTTWEKEKDRAGKEVHTGGQGDNYDEDRSRYTKINEEGREGGTEEQNQSIQRK